jgi:hypothetical protein
VSTVADIARVCRSKNAGAALLTLDICFDENHWYEAAKTAVSNEVVARLYNIDTQDIQRVCWDEMLTIKLTFPRKPLAGAPGDRDVYGCQQHAPLLTISL